MLIKYSYNVIDWIMISGQKVAHRLKNNIILKLLIYPLYRLESKKKNDGLWDLFLY